MNHVNDDLSQISLSDNLGNFTDMGMKFMEMEVLRQIHYYKHIDIAELYKYLDDQFDGLGVSLSQFYRIIDKMYKDNLLEKKKIKKTIQISCSDKGHKKIRGFIRYILGFLADQVFSTDTLEELRRQILKNVPEQFATKFCLRQMRMMTMGPRPIDLVRLQDLCPHCIQSKEPSPTQIMPIFVDLPGSEYDMFSNPRMQKIYLEHPFEINQRNGSINLIIMNLILYRYSRKSSDGVTTSHVLKELHRILADTSGVLVLFEPTSDVGDLFLQLTNQVLLAAGNTDENWTIDSKILMSSNEIKEMLLSHGFRILGIQSDMALTQFICQKELEEKNE